MRLINFMDCLRKAVMADERQQITIPDYFLSTTKNSGCHHGICRQGYLLNACSVSLHMHLHREFDCARTPAQHAARQGLSPFHTRNSEAEPAGVRWPASLRRLR